MFETEILNVCLIGSLQWAKRNGVYSSRFGFLGKSIRFESNTDSFVVTTTIDK
jgi:hypothetical protein